MRGRKPLPMAEPLGIEVDQAQLAIGTQAVDDVARLEAAVTHDQLAFSQRIGERIGRRRAADAFSKLVTVTDLLELQQIKDSGAYKGQKFMDPAGKVVAVTTWAEFCSQVEGRSREQIDADLLNLKTFGEDFMEAAQRMGIGYRELREMRSLPADQQAELLAVADSGDKGAFVEVAEELIARHAAERKKWEAKEAGARQETAAVRKVLEKRTEELTRIQEAAETKAAAGAEEQALADLQSRVLTAQTGLMQLFALVKEFAEQDLTDEFRNLVNGDVTYLAQIFEQLIVEGGIPVDFQEMAKPSWLQQGKKAKGA